MPHRLLRSLAAALALACAAAGVLAGETSARLLVTATIKPFFRMHLAPHPQMLQVAAADVARGYMDLPAPVQLGVETNTRSPYSIRFARTGDHVAAAQVQGMGRQLQVVSEAGMDWTPRAQREMLDFRVRVELAPQLAPGEYPWPILVSVDAL